MYGFPWFLQPGCPVDHQAGRLDVRRHFGDHPLDPLEFRNGLPKLDPLLRISHRPVESSLGQSHRHGRNGQPPCIQRGQELLEALILRAQQVFRRNMAVLEEELGCDRTLQTHFLFIPPRLEARRALFQDEG